MNDAEINFTVNDGFMLLETRLDILSEDRAKISSRQAEIEKYLGRYIDKFVTVLSGGYSRNTMIAPLEDNQIHLHVLFPETHSGRHSPEDMLDKLFVTLQDEYPEAERDALHKTVIVSFPELTFKIIPGFVCKDGSYLVPDIATAPAGDLPMDLLPGLSLEAMPGLMPGNAWINVD